LSKVLDGLTMQIFVRGYCTMIAAPVQGDVDGIPAGLHNATVAPDGEQQQRSQLDWPSRKLICPGATWL
jgi:hypothetical protein